MTTCTDANGTVRIWDTTQAEHMLKYEYKVLSGAVRGRAGCIVRMRLLLTRCQTCAGLRTASALWLEATAASRSPRPFCGTGLWFGVCALHHHWPRDSGSSVGTVDGHTKAVNSVDFRSTRSVSLCPSCPDSRARQPLQRRHGQRGHAHGLLPRPALQAGPSQQGAMHALGVGPLSLARTTPASST